MRRLPRPARTLAELTPRQQLAAGRMPRRLLQLFVGLTAYGVSMSMFVRAGLGLDPWDVFHYGIAKHTGLDLGTAVICVSVPVLLLWIPLRLWPGLGTVANAIWIGIATNIALAAMPAPHAMGWRIGLMLAAVLLNGAAGALYIGSQLGPGPRDGLMVGLHQRTGMSLRIMRTSVEVTVFALGWLLGGVVGVGTVVYAVCIGPIVQYFLPLFIVDLPNGTGVDPRPVSERKPRAPGRRCG